mmetsp:Transcript_62134/g.180143  ORF Transcript_62134/g.180143 Transcript_62134/m.180143 type:complete len:232 (-) Transcript_62134:453-1148(-)
MSSSIKLLTLANGSSCMCSAKLDNTWLLSRADALFKNAAAFNCDASGVRNPLRIWSSVADFATELIERRSATTCTSPLAMISLARSNAAISSARTFWWTANCDAFWMHVALRSLLYAMSSASAVAMSSASFPTWMDLRSCLAFSSDLSDFANSAASTCEVKSCWSISAACCREASVLSNSSIFALNLSCKDSSIVITSEDFGLYTVVGTPGTNDKSGSSWTRAAAMSATRS